MGTKRVISYLTCIIFIGLALYLSYYCLPYNIATTFPDNANVGDRLVNPANITIVEGTIPNFIWDFRSLDLLIQAMVIFAATIALALFFKRYKVEEVK
ncbi:MAG: hypothetical protein ACP6IP_03455 [Candidatus Njordarchaeia archaeon]